jgi:hypothetical protein
MPAYIGDTAIGAAYVGDTAASAIYLGDTQVWSATVPISFVDGAEAAAATVTIPTHQVGDLLLIVALRPNASTPSLPAGWTSLAAPTTTGKSYQVGYKIATATNDASGTWTNAAVTQVFIYRNAGVPGTPTVNLGAATAGNETFPALTLSTLSGTSWCFRYIYGNTGSRAGSLAGYTVRGVSTISSNVANFDSNAGLTANPTADTTTGVSGTSANYIAISLELKSL